MSRCFRANMVGIDRLLGTFHNVVVDAVFHEGRPIPGSKQLLSIRLVLGKEKFRRTFAMEPASIRLRLVRLRSVQFNEGIRSGAHLVELRALGTTSPRPGVAEPNCGKNP